MNNERTITFEIKEHFGKLNDSEEGWAKELNLVAWNEADAKYDIRDWNADHTRMRRGITLTAQEAEGLYRLLEQKFERKSARGQSKTTILNERKRYFMENIDFDYILEEYNTSEFYEAVISIGGDVCKYRCYGNRETGFRIGGK